jgi:recombinational DNA repair protein (RecF pathway)
VSTVSHQECATCGRSLARGAYVLGGECYCFRCAARQRPLLWRSVRTALVVGTILVAINQGTVLAAGEFPAALLWKIALTYVVPFCVVSWGPLGAAHR